MLALLRSSVPKIAPTGVPNFRRLLPPGGRLGDVADSLWYDGTPYLHLPPDTAWLYKFLDHESTVLYIGQTARHPSARFADHRRDALHGRRVVQYSSWWPCVVKADIAQVPLTWVSELETSLIHATHPVGNLHCPVEGCLAYGSPSARGGTAAHLAATTRYLKKAGFSVA